MVLSKGHFSCGSLLCNCLNVLGTTSSHVWSVKCIDCRFAVTAELTVCVVSFIVSHCLNVCRSIQSIIWRVTYYLCTCQRATGWWNSSLNQTAIWTEALLKLCP